MTSKQGRSLLWFDKQPFGRVESKEHLKVHDWFSAAHIMHSGSDPTWRLFLSWELLTLMKMLINWTMKRTVKMKEKRYVASIPYIFLNVKPMIFFVWF